MFTFITITYNHEKYIIEHLESIKYQIENYGTDKEFKLLICDDCSTDKTIEIVKRWLERYPQLFTQTDITESIANQGIVKNYIRAIEALESSNYKILAGDDLFFSNNIFNVLQDNDLVFTPVIKFDNENICKDYSMNFLIKNKKIQQIRKWLRVGNLFSAPGVFLSFGIIKNPGLKEQLYRYKWIEDLPMWHYIFYKMKNVKFTVNTNPYILYRKSSGITVDYRKKKDSEFFREIECMRRSLNMKFYWLPLKINPYKIYKKIISFKINHIDAKINSNLIEYKENMLQAINAVPSYLGYLKDQSYIFYKHIGEEEIYDYQPSGKS